MNGVRRGRTRLFALILTAWAAVVVARLVQVQIAQGSRYRARAARQQERRIEIAASRGSILDREGRELAVSVEASSVYAIPDDVQNSKATAQALAPLLGMPAAEILEKLGSEKGFVWIRRQLDTEAAEKVRALKLPGVHFVVEPRRFYPKGRLAGAVLGFVGTDGGGLAGLEHLYDKAIRGKPGEMVALTDARRSRYGELEAANSRPAQEGSSLVLSLDSGVQFAAEHELSAAMAEHRAKSGSVVVLDPWNGEILAMASAPDFDPNDFGRYPAESRRNRVIADSYEPGSTFKIVTGALALEEAVVSLDEIIDTGDGTIRVANTTIQEAKGHRYGALTLGGIFEHSSNIGIIRVGLRLGPRRLFEGARSFGVGQPTGIDLPGENTGIFRPLPRWSALSNAEISMGQEVSLNALQLARDHGDHRQRRQARAAPRRNEDRRAGRRRAGGPAAGAVARALGGDGPVDLAHPRGRRPAGNRQRRRQSRASSWPARPARRRRPGSAGTAPGATCPISRASRRRITRAASPSWCSRIPRASTTPRRSRPRSSRR